MEDKHVHTIAKSDSQQIRFTVREYKGRKYLDIRVFFLAEDAEHMYPTKKGITVPIEHLQDLAKGLKKVAQALPEQEYVNP